MKVHGHPLSPTTERLLAARFWRSIAQGALVVDLALYLHALNWSGAAIGAVLSGAGIAGAGLGLVVGIASDRCGRKRFLLAYEAICCACGIVALLTTQPAMLAGAIILAGFGRGANGAAGPFAPAEQAWIAETVEPRLRGAVFSLNSALGFLGMGIGALLAMIPGFAASGTAQQEDFRLLFLVVIVGNAANVWLISRAREEPRPRQPAHADAPVEVSRERRQQENRFLRRLTGLNALNGFAIGLTGPLMSYWFSRRFGVGPVFIAPVMALTFVVTAAAAFYTGRLTRRSGLVNVVVWGRTGGLVLLLLLPVMPVYSLAATLFLLRSAFNRGTIGARQALVVSAVQDRRRGFASSVNALSGQFPQSLGPAVAGALMGSGWLIAPFYVAAALQGAYLLWYGRLFRPIEESMNASEPSASR